MRVRFAPSPTGYLHVGGARTAIFNFLLARKCGGTFVLRIEDTDQARSSDEMVEQILDSLRWLGLDWDEGPFFQSRRTELYAARARELLASGAAYRCYCTLAELDAKKKLAEAEKRTHVYDGTCRDLGADERARRDAAGTPSVVRVRVAEGTVAWDDAVQGRIEVKSETIDDFVLLRSDGSPTYHLTVVADDVDMTISHVIRGADHISNTPKQILLYRALHAEPPLFGHVPLILGEDKKKLSKRHGITSVGAYRDDGILPQALLNFLTLLGWSPGGDREIMTLAEMTAAFDLEGINKSNAVFDRKKLDWMNAQYVMRLPDEILMPRVKEAVARLGLWRDDLDGERAGWLRSIVAELRPRSRVVADIADGARPFLEDTFDYEPAAIEKRLSAPGLGDHVAALRAAYAELPSWDEAAAEAALRSVAEARDVKAPVLIHALRVGLTGRMAGPSLFFIVATLGRAEVLARLDRLLTFLAGSG